MDGRLLTVEDNCLYLNVSNKTIYKWIERRKMPADRVGRRWMFKQGKADDWVRSEGAANKLESPDMKRDGE